MERGAEWKRETRGLIFRVTGYPLAVVREVLGSNCAEGQTQTAEGNRNVTGVQVGCRQSVCSVMQHQAAGPPEPSHPVQLSRTHRSGSLLYRRQQFASLSVKYKRRTYFLRSQLSAGPEARESRDLLLNAAALARTQTPPQILSLIFRRVRTVAVFA